MRNLIGMNDLKHRGNKEFSSRQITASLCARAFGAQLPPEPWQSKVVWVCTATRINPAEIMGKLSTFNDMKEHH
jgi:hypothetical protein